MKKSKVFDKLKLKQETQGRCGMCFYYPSDLAGLEIAHIIPRFKVNANNEFNAISISELQRSLNSNRVNARNQESNFNTKWNFLSS